MLLGNDAYADALDPTVGLGTTSALANRAPAIFAFMNQFRSDSFGLIDEELALLRGRDETLGGVAAGADLQPADLELHQRRRRSGLRR